jgi:hypothetical protein
VEDDECIIEDTTSTKGGKAWCDLGQLQAALTVVSKLQIHLLNPSHVEKEDEIAGEDFLVDWDCPPIEDIYHDKEDLMEKVSL